jgi:hypothetical protein
MASHLNNLHSLPSWEPQITHLELPLVMYFPFPSEYTLSTWTLCHHCVTWIVTLFPQRVFAREEISLMAWVNKWKFCSCDSKDPSLAVELLALLFYIWKALESKANPKTEHLKDFSDLRRTGWSRGTALDLYSGGAQFEFRPGHRLFWGFYWFSSLRPGNFRNNTLNRQRQHPSRSFLVNLSPVIPFHSK